MYKIFLLTPSALATYKMMYVLLHRSDLKYHVKIGPFQTGSDHLDLRNAQYPCRVLGRRGGGYENLFFYAKIHFTSTNLNVLRHCLTFFYNTDCVVEKHTPNFCRSSYQTTIVIISWKSGFDPGKIMEFCFEICVWTL